MKPTDREARTGTKKGTEKGEKQRNYKEKPKKEAGPGHPDD